MTEPVPPTKDLDAEAAQWVVRAMSDEAGDDDLKALTDWLEASPDHLEAYARAEAVWDATSALKAAPVAAINVVPFPAPRKKPSPAIRPLWLYGGGLLAASLVAAIALRPHDTPHWQSFATARGEHRAVVLADGTQAHLNSGTRIRVDISRSSRRIELEQGEIALTVVHDPARPFAVAAGGATIRDIGTQFDVQKGDGRVVVTVREGRVSLGGADGTAEIGAGQQAAYTEDKGVGKVQAVEAGDAFAWQDGRAVYHDVPLRAVVADLNRYLDKPLIVRGTTAELKVTAVITLDSEAKIVKALEAFVPVTAVDTADGVELRSR